MKLFLCMPCIDGSITATTAQSIWRFAKRPEVVWDFATYMWNHDLVRVRNRAIYEFLKSDCSHLWFVDSDVGFTPEVPLAMIRSGFDFVAGAYPKKMIDWTKAGELARGGSPETSSPVAWAFTVKPDSEERGPFKKAELVPMGMTILSRKLCEAVTANAPTYGDRYGNVGDLHQVPAVFNLAMIEQEQGMALLPEDYSFTMRARHFGFDPWVLIDPICTHTGSMRFDVREIAGKLVGG
jgi:hypothetical protein